MSVKGKMNYAEYIYDFAVDGGAQGEIVLSSKDNKSSLPEGAVIHDVKAKVLTLFASGGAATLAWGNSTDPDGYSGSAKALGALAADAVFSGLADSAALANSAVGSADNDQNFSVTIAAADMTAGKAVFMVEYYLPAIEQ